MPISLGFLNWHCTHINHSYSNASLHTQRVQVKKSLGPARYYGNTKMKTQHKKMCSYFMEYIDGSLPDSSNSIVN